MPKLNVIGYFNAKSGKLKAPLLACYSTDLEVRLNSIFSIDMATTLQNRGLAHRSCRILHLDISVDVLMLHHV